MPTSYTSLLGLALPVTGELAGTWGDTVNNYITSYVDASVAGTQTISGSQTAVTLSVTNGSSLVTAGSGATGSAQFQIINCTGNPGGLLTITAPASSRQYIIINATSTNQSVKIVGAGPTTGVTLVAGEKAHVAWNGSDFVKIATQSGNGSFVDLTVSGNLTLSGGTANGVLYLNASKVATSGSALTFDGTGALSLANTGNVISTIQSTSTGGTRSATLRLNVASTGGDDPAGKILFTYGSGFTEAAAIDVSHTNPAMKFSLGTVEKMRLFGSSLNIGGNFTSTNNTLQVTGNAAIGYTTAAPTTGLIVAGNVGIGTDSPSGASGSRVLSLYTAASSSDAARLTFKTGYSGNASGNGFQIGFDTTDTAFLENRQNGPMAFATNNAERLRIDSSGTFILRQSSNAANTSVSFNTTVQNALTLDSSGNLGLGTTTTTNGRLNVQAGTSATGNSAFFSNPDGTYNPYLQIQHSSAGVKLFNGSTFGAASNNLIFGNAGTSETMRIDGSGNLGLGVTPSAWGYPALQIREARSVALSGYTTGGNFGVNCYDNAGWKYGGTGFSSRYQQDSDSGAHQWYTAASGTAGNAISFTQAMTLDASGNLGIGSTTALGTEGRLGVYATGDQTSEQVAAAMIGSWDSGGMRMYFGVNNTNQYTYIGSVRSGIDYKTLVLQPNGGNVGIGTTNPGTKLDVAGTIQSNGVFSVNGTTTGTASKVWFGSDGASGGFINVPSSQSLSIYQNNATLVAKFDSSGNLGLGVTPSAWASTAKAIQLGEQGAIEYRGSGTSISTNAYYNVTWNYITSNPAALYNQYQNSHAWYVAASGTAGNAITFTQAMTLDASGNLRIGTTNDLSAADRLTVVGGNIAVQRTSGITTFIGDNTQNGYAGTITNHAFALLTNSTERARITSGGDLLIGSTTDVAQRVRITYDNVTPQWGMKMHSTATSGDNNFIEFGTEATFTVRGSITYNRAGGAIAYNTTSDYRAKDIIGPVQNSGQVIDALKVYTGKMKGATIERPMLVAHEAQEHVPYAVTGEKDAVNEDGTAKFQQMDVSSLVPLLLAEIQSLRARVAQLEAK